VVSFYCSSRKKFEQLSLHVGGWKPNIPGDTSLHVLDGIDTNIEKDSSACWMEWSKSPIRSRKTTDNRRSACIEGTWWRRRQITDIYSANLENIKTNTI